MEIAVRVATQEDIDLVVDRRIEFLASVRGPQFEASGEFRAQTSEWVASEHGAGRLHTWIAENDSHFCGMVSLLLWPRPPQPEDVRTTEAYIINMYVPAEFQRRGIGKRLLDTCLASAESFGIRKFLLHTTEAGEPLYTSMGFVPKANWMELPMPS